MVSYFWDPFLEARCGVMVHEFWVVWGSYSEDLGWEVVGRGFWGLWA